MEVSAKYKNILAAMQEAGRVLEGKDVARHFQDMYEAQQMIALKELREYGIVTITEKQLAAAISQAGQEILRSMGQCTTLEEKRAQNALREVLDKECRSMRDVGIHFRNSVRHEKAFLSVYNKGLSRLFVDNAKGIYDGCRAYLMEHY